MLSRILVTDDPQAQPADVDLVLWLGREPAPGSLKLAVRVIESSSRRAAVVHLASQSAVVRFQLDDPLSFTAELAAVDKLPALRAA